MKKFLVAIALLGFGFSAHADRGLEIQINTGFAGTSGSFNINDEDAGDNSPWSLGGEVYKSMTDNFQLGGILAVADADAGGDTTFVIGVAGRYNFDAELRDSMFVGAAVTMADFGDVDQIAAHLQFGKRYALSDTITWTPSLEMNMAVGGDLDEGMTISINLLSFSGFM